MCVTWGTKSQQGHGARLPHKQLEAVPTRRLHFGVEQTASSVANHHETVMCAPLHGTIWSAHRALQQPITASSTDRPVL
jgi:hypothetical protein